MSGPKKPLANGSCYSPQTGSVQRVNIPPLWRKRNPQNPANKGLPSPADTCLNK